jgi:hypothetical protein
VQQVSTSGVNVSCLFIAEHSEVETAGAVERERVENSTSGEQVRVPEPQAEQLKLEQQYNQVDYGQPGVIKPGSPEV